MTPKERLAEAVQQFKVWADSVFPDGRGGEWETEYPDWGLLYDAAKSVLGTDCERWDNETKELLLYSIARDNEVELLAGTLTEEGVNVLGLHSLTTDERDAKWQLAEQMRRFPLTIERERILIAYSQDIEEYVRRIALMVLADLASPYAEKIALSAWKDGGEYQRMACLHALAILNSPALGEYLEMAEFDGRPHLRALSGKIRDRRDEYGNKK